MKTNWTEYALMTEDGLFWNKRCNSKETLLTSDLKDMTRWHDPETPAELVTSLKEMAEIDEKMKEVGEVASRLKVVEVTVSLEVIQ
jgi:hypothetical protein